MPESEYILYLTADFLIDSLDAYDQLHEPNGEFNQLFIKKLVEVLRNSRLKQTNLRGAYLDLYLPIDVDGDEKRVAVKLTNKTNNMYSAARDRMRNQLTLEELQLILNDTSYFFLDYKQSPPKFTELKEEEQVFAFLALEHKRYVRYYSPYVLPAVFIGYTRDEDEVKDLVWPPGTEGWEYQVETLSVQGKLTRDDREIVARKGETVFAMAQDFKVLGSSVFKLDRTQLTQFQRTQILEIADKFETVFNQTGYFPDESMANRSDKLRFIDTGNLVLIDTNHLNHRDHVSGASTYYIKILRDIANNVSIVLPEKRLNL